MHEYSHIFGTTEDEAVAIQKEALAIFSKVDFSTHLPGIVAGLAISLRAFDVIGATTVYNEIYELKKFLYRGGVAPDSLAIENLNTRLLQTFQGLTMGGLNIYGRLWFTPKNTNNRWLPMFAKFTAATKYLCSIDASESALRRNYCQAFLDAAFDSKRSISAKDFYDHIGDKSVCPSSPIRCVATNHDKEFVTTKITLPQSVEEAKAELVEFDRFLDEVTGALNSLSQCGARFGKVVNCSAPGEP